jgi:DNA repair exonuclease SbcCD ATPase subunit
MFIAAQNSLHEKYIGPMETSFNAYAEKINRFVKEDATINFSFDVRYENGTKEHLSEGLRACLALCMRLAVIDNMYPDEKPFLILDDPFVNLDATNIESAIKVLRELSNEIQIIYFSCHESRAI